MNKTEILTALPSRFLSTCWRTQTLSRFDQACSEYGRSHSDTMEGEQLSAVGKAKNHASTVLLSTIRQHQPDAESQRISATKRLE
jgi:hypothetical protein